MLLRPPPYIVYYLLRQLHKILKGKKEDDEMHDGKSNNLPIEEGCLSKGNVIIYVWRQKDTEIVAEQLIGAGVSGGVVCYHGGMDANDRSRAQSKVCCRIVQRLLLYLLLTLQLSLATVSQRQS